MRVSAYTKAIVALIAAAVATLIPTLGDNTVDAAELVNVGIAVVTAFGVYITPLFNKEGHKTVAKTVVTIAGAALAALVNIVGPGLGWGDVTTADWLTVFLAAATAVGVYVLPNEQDPHEDENATPAELRGHRPLTGSAYVGGAGLE